MNRMPFVSQQKVVHLFSFFPPSFSATPPQTTPPTPCIHISPNARRDNKEWGWGGEREWVRETAYENGHPPCFVGLAVRLGGGRHSGWARRRGGWADRAFVHSSCPRRGHPRVVTGCRSGSSSRTVGCSITGTSKYGCDERHSACPIDPRRGSRACSLGCVVRVAVVLLRCCCDHSCCPNLEPPWPMAWWDPTYFRFAGFPFSPRGLRACRSRR